MPAVKPTAGAKNVLAKLKAGGASKAFDGHKSDETKFGAGGDLPDGIEGGIAKLTEAKLDLHKEGKNKDKPYMMLTGIVVSPKTHNGLNVEGLRASKIIGLYAVGQGKSAKTQDDQIGVALNEMRKLGIETKDLSLDDWEDALNALLQEGPYFRFRTWKGEATPQFPNPRVNVEFRGKCEFTENGEGTEPHLEDSTESAAEEGQEAEPAEGDEDWAALGELADGGDTDAATKITAKAEELGIKDEAEGAENWTAAGVLIVETLAGGAPEGGDEGEPTPEPWKPKKGDFYDYKKPGARKAVSYEVTAVFAETVNLKAVEGGEVLRAVKWTSDPMTLGGKPLE
jgi:hypothetical protein